MVISIFCQRFLLGVTVFVFGFDTAFGAVMSEPAGADVVGVVSSELSPGENANVDGGVSPDFGIVSDRDKGAFKIGARGRVAAQAAGTAGGAGLASSGYAPLGGVTPSRCSTQ